MAGRKPDEWFARLFAYLLRTWSTDNALKSLRSLDLIPLESGTLASAEKGQVFSPLDRRTSYGFERELRVVRRSLLKGGDPPAVEGRRVSS